ncbi:GDSL-like Lipase/Acylhydrolase [compost metagenome]
MVQQINAVVGQRGRLTAKEVVLSLPLSGLVLVNDGDVVVRTTDGKSVKSVVGAIALRDSVFADDNTAAVTRLQSSDLGTVDYVTIFYGTNDFQGLIPIGTDTDATGDTFKGAINLSLDKLLTKHPNLKILLVTPIWRARQVSGDSLESDNNPNSLGLYLRDYVEAIKDMGKKYHIPVLDLYKTSGISKYTKNLYLSADELHPNTVGYTHLANLIAAKLSSTY